MAQEGQIGKTEGRMMLLVALCIDLFQIAFEGAAAMALTFSVSWINVIPVIGQAIQASAAAAGFIVASVIGLFFSMLGFVTLSMWFYMNKVRFAGKLGAAAAVEVIPFLNFVPALTLATFLTLQQAGGKGGVLSMIFGGTLHGQVEASPTQARPTMPNVAERREELPEEAVQEEPRRVGAEMRPPPLRAEVGAREIRGKVDLAA